MASQNSSEEVPLNVIPISSIPPSHLEEAEDSNLRSTATPSKIAPPNPSDFFKDEENFPHANTPSIVTETKLRNLRIHYQIPDTHLIRIPASQERMYQRPEGWTAMPITLLEKGVLLPLHAFVITLLRFVGVGFAQLVPNSYIHLMAFIAFCYEQGIPPAVDFFFTLFIAGKSRERGFKMLSKQSPKPNGRFEKRSLMDTPSSNQGWHKEWFFVKGPEISSIPDWTTSDRISANFGNFSADRVREMANLLGKIHTKEWSFGLLSKQAWLYDHNLTLIKPMSIDRRDLDKFLSGDASPPPTEGHNERPLTSEAPTTESIPTEEMNRLRRRKQVGRKHKTAAQNHTEDILNESDDEQTPILRTKKRKTRVNSPAPEEAQVPSTETDLPSTTPVDIVDSDEEIDEQAERSVKHDRKREPNSSDSRPEAMGSSTLWPETEDNFPFELYNSFVCDSDDHRFNNNSIMNLIDEGMKYHAKANAAFGRLRPKYKEVEAEVKAALWDKEYLQKDLTQTKKDLKTSRATHQVITDINIDLLKKNEILAKEIEDLTRSNSVLSKQNKDIQAKDAEHMACRKKLEEELRELRAIRDLGPPLTDQLREQIRDEYRKSGELNEKVIKMFSDGYYDCRSKDKAKLVTVKVDPTVLDSSEDEVDL